MPENKSEKGKVLEFKPRKKRKLKTVDYVDPAQKELRQKRNQEKKSSETRDAATRNVGYFLLICIIYYILKTTVFTGG